MSGARGKLVVLGLSGLDWDGTAERIRAGRLPALAALVARGTAFRLAPSRPADGLAAWATIATGVAPGEHGIFVSEEAWAGGLRPTGRQSWAQDPVWLRLADAGVRTASVGWPATAPGAAWPGIHIDPRISVATGRGADDWLVAPGTGPAPWIDHLAAMRVHPTEIESEMLAPFVPDRARVDQARDHRLVELALGLAALSTTHGCATALMQEDGWDALFVHHAWLGWAAPRFDGAGAPFDQVVEAAWTLLDALIGATIAALPAGATLILLSPGREGRTGLLVAAGPAIVGQRAVGRATIRDAVPTILAFFGLADASLPGTALFGTGEPVRHAPPLRGAIVPTTPDASDLDRVGAFGHAPPSPPPQWSALALAAQAELRLASDPAQAIALAKAATALDPSLLLAIGTRASGHVALEEAEPLPALADRIASIAPGHVWEALIRAGYHALRGEASLAAPLLRRVESDGGTEELLRAGAGWLMLGRSRDAARAFAAALAIQPDNMAALLGLASANSDRPIEAEQALRRALSVDPQLDGARTALVDLLTATGRKGEAARLLAGTAR